MLIRLVLLIAFSAPVLAASTPRTLSSEDLFELQYASDVAIAPDGSQIAYLRAVHDIMRDAARSNLWLIDVETGAQRPLLSDSASYSSPAWSPDGSRLAYVGASDGKPQLFVRWVASGETALLTNLTEAPSALAWSPDGSQIAFTMQVPAEKPSLAKPPKKPEGAEWAPEVTVIDAVTYRFDGRGYLEPGFSHVFVVSADGGNARRLTSGEFDHSGPLAWSPDGARIALVANRNDDWQYQRSESDLYVVEVASGALSQLTDLPGRETAPAWSPDGARIAFERNDHQGRQYSDARIAVIDADGSKLRVLTADLDRPAASPVWSADGRQVYFRFDDRGQRKVARVGLDGKRELLVDSISGTTIGRPYLSGAFSVAALRRHRLHRRQRAATGRRPSAQPARCAPALDRIERKPARPPRPGRSTRDCLFVGRRRYGNPGLVPDPAGL
ncbi:MAG: DPP IV N-terminal domain-containing protein [Wenzhouxiangellaceae bacterium]|nr:DPP IV N-terminal domain-containing protein [Wenzhouxiangellaceae bacterium]